jgi:hypothetical protein
VHDLLFEDGNPPAQFADALDGGLSDGVDVGSQLVGHWMMSSSSGWGS